MKKLFALITILATVVSFAACAAPVAATTAPAATATETPAATTAAPTATPEATTAAPVETATPTPAPIVSGIEAKDFLGDTVKLAAVPLRIVSLTPSNTEILYALGLQDKLVGVDAFYDYPAEAVKLEKIRDFNGPNLEKIASLKPDLVLAGNKLQKDTIDKLKALGLNVAATEGTAYADISTSIALVGTLTGAQDQAKALTDEMKRKETIVLDAVDAAKVSKTVYLAISYGQFGDYSAGPGSFPYEMIALCGSTSITKDISVPWPQMTLEDIVKKDPQIILLSSDLGDIKTFATTAGYKDLSAVKKNQVYSFTSNLCMRPGPRMVDGLKEFAQIICGITISFDK